MKAEQATLTREVDELLKRLFPNTYAQVLEDLN